MNRRVVVFFDAGRSYRLDVADEAWAELSEEDARECARGWLMDEFEALGCEPPNPMGKLLLPDLVLGVARAAGEPRFAGGPSPWTQRYAAAVLCLRGAEMVEVDVAEYLLRPQTA